jgi:hypothetical protein
MFGTLCCASSTHTLTNLGLTAQVFVEVLEPCTVDLPDAGDIDLGAGERFLVRFGDFEALMREGKVWRVGLLTAFTL